MKNPKRFYIYCLFRPWNGEPCYIGKGSGTRTMQHVSTRKRHHNPHLAAIIKKAEGGVPCVILHEGLDEGTAFEYERAFIAALGRSDLGLGPLCNMTDGGDGASGAIASPERRASVSLVHSGKKLTSAQKAAVSVAQKGRSKSKGHREKLRMANLGKKWPEEQKVRMSAIMTGRKMPDSHKEKVGNFHRGRKNTEEAKARMRASWVIRKAKTDRQLSLPLGDSKQF